MKNPFEEQAKYHKREALKWKVASIVAGIIGFMIFLALFTC